MAHSGYGFHLTTEGFVSEVLDFRQSVQDPARSDCAKRRAYDLIVRHAALLDPSDAGFPAAGVALKEALLAWLDCESASRH